MSADEGIGGFTGLFQRFPEGVIGDHSVSSFLIKILWCSLTLYITDEDRHFPAGMKKTSCIFLESLYNGVTDQYVSRQKQTYVSRRTSRMKIRRILGGFAWVVLAAALILVNAAAASGESLQPGYESSSVSAVFTK